MTTRVDNDNKDNDNKDGDDEMNTRRSVAGVCQRGSFVNRRAVGLSDGRGSEMR